MGLDDPTFVQPDRPTDVGHRRLVLLRGSSVPKGRTACSPSARHRWVIACRRCARRSQASGSGGLQRDGGRSPSAPPCVPQRPIGAHICLLTSSSTPMPLACRKVSPSRTKPADEHAPRTTRRIPSRWRYGLQQNFPCPTRTGRRWGPITGRTWGEDLGRRQTTAAGTPDGAPTAAMSSRPLIPSADRSITRSRPATAGTGQPAT